MPAGLILASNGYIYGTPIQSGTFTFTVSAANSGGTSSKDFTVVIASDGSTPAPTPASDDTKPAASDDTKPTPTPTPNRTVSVSAYLEAGKTYAPVISAVNMDTGVSSSSGGCSAGIPAFAVMLSLCAIIFRKNSR